MSATSFHTRALLLYFVLYFLLAFVWRSWRVYQQSGVNPLVLPSGHDAYAYVARGFKLCLVVVALVLVAGAAFPGATYWFGPYEALQHAALAWVGWALLIVSLPFLLLAQQQMGQSWRIGIDQQRHTSLVQHGLFKHSRNPIFLAMRVTLLGAFCVLPSAVMLALLVAAEILIQVQVRLEEQHLLKLHGASYQAYCQKARRWL